jgi:signal transduction histidine kinase
MTEDTETRTVVFVDPDGSLTRLAQRLGEAADSVSTRVVDGLGDVDQPRDEGAVCAVTPAESDAIPDNTALPVFAYDPGASSPVTPISTPPEGPSRTTLATVAAVGAAAESRPDRFAHEIREIQADLLDTDTVDDVVATVESVAAVPGLSSVAVSLRPGAAAGDGTADAAAADSDGDGSEQATDAAPPGATLPDVLDDVETAFDAELRQVHYLRPVEAGYEPVPHGGTVDPAAAPDGTTAVVAPLSGHGTLGVASERALDRGTLTVVGTFVEQVAATLDRLERESALERENDELQEFAKVLSHDLRNPLNGALAFVGAMEDEGVSDEYLGRVRKSLLRMERMTDELLTIARENQTVEDPEEVAFTTVVERAWQTSKADHTALSIQGPLGGIYADDDRLLRLFENLFRNVAEHARGEDADEFDPDEDDPVVITVSRLDDADGFYVADDGVGIPPDKRADVLEMGYTDSLEGTGYGLHIVAEIARAHGWRVTVTDSESGGARFEFTGADFS